jgi:hypothetical protein
VIAMLHGKLVGTMNTGCPEADEALAMISMGRLPGEVTRTELAQVNAS